MVSDFSRTIAGTRNDQKLKGLVLVNYRVFWSGAEKSAKI